MCESLASACPFRLRLSHLPAEGGEGGVCADMLLYVFMCVCICGCITYVGVKKCYIFTSCCLSLLIDAQQRCRVASACTATFHRSTEKTSADIFRSQRNVPVSTLFCPFDPILQTPHPTHLTRPISLFLFCLRLLSLLFLLQAFWVPFSLHAEAVWI